MNQHSTESQGDVPKDLSRISSLARRYAQNRSLGVIVSSLIFLILFAGVAGSSSIAGAAYRSGNTLLLIISVVVLVTMLPLVVFFSVPGWGGRFQARIVERLYASEGKAAFTSPSPNSKTVGLAMACCFAICVAASVVLSFVYEIPDKYQQPISSLYVTPFLVMLWVLMRPSVGYISLMWPLLYALHAILTLAGAPLVFTRPWDWLNIVIPLSGYGILSALVSHFYSRIAFHQLRSLAASDSTNLPHEVTEQ